MGSVFYVASEKIKHFFAVKRNRYITLIFLLGFVLFYLMKGCHLNTLSDENYYIGQDTRWRSINLMGKERNVSAFSNDLLATIAKLEHIHIQVVITAESELIPDLEKDNLQGILTAAPTNYLNEKFLFSEPYFPIGHVLIISSTAPVEGWNEKGKKIIGIQAKDHQLLKLAQDPSIQIKVYNDMLTALADLSERRIDGAILPVIPAYTYVTTFYKNDLKIATLPLTDEGIRLVVPKNQKGEFLIKHFNEGLAMLKENKSYYKMLERWGLINIEDIVINHDTSVIKPQTDTNN